MRSNTIFKTLILIIGGIIMFSSCFKIPKGASAVKNFEADKYLGLWYEIARFDFRFERGLNNTTAHYSLNKDGSIKVVNRGYDYTKMKWGEAVGKAKFIETRDVARLKVSFFGPFYASYNVIALDKDYKYALVAGKTTSYLWILARETSIPDNIKKDYLKIADDLGFQTSQFIWVEHDKK